jgi:hypothetical protein
VNVQVLRCLHIGHASILDQAHGLKLELSRKLPSLHDPPPAPSKHLTRCLRNRVQAMSPDLRLSDNLIDLMKDFSLSSAQGIGGAWGLPPGNALRHALRAMVKSLYPRPPTTHGLVLHVGKSSPTFDLKMIGNIISGLIGGGVLGQIITLLLPAITAAAQSGNLSVEGIISQVIAGGAGGAILTAIIGAIKNKAAA